MAPLFHKLPILSAKPFAVEATKFTPSFTLWLAVFMPSTAAFPARLATFPIGTKFRSVHPAAMSLSFDDNSFPVIGSLPVTARIATIFTYSL